eukprot:TRINITY_DN7058_c0_g1_i1.p1 TRINITY_DN7058_c0_g1~~TRINITY_DN7058_c0_g1_i1.p1  ORF type:complete len:296 (+),score=45.58 TRINITY_DN7058_c0_g1_i1:58-945(+)
MASSEAQTVGELVHNTYKRLLPQQAIDFNPNLNILFEEVPKLAEFSSILIVVAVYLTVVFVFREYMKTREAWKPSIPLFFHNAFLTLVSLTLVAGPAYWFLNTYLKHGLFAVYCGSSEQEDIPIISWSYLFYLSKYYELLDTIFLVMRKKDLTFLHVWHHCIVIVVCWYAVKAEIIMGWITAFQNAFVHVFMYYYFAMSAIGVRIWWRKYLTSLQILQFILDFLTSLPFLFFWKFGPACRGLMSCWIVANSVGMSFFFLFVNFYQKQYKKPAAKPQGTDSPSTRRVTRSRSKKAD